MMSTLVETGRHPARLLVTGMLTLLVAAALLLPAAHPAAAGANWYTGQCSVGYNYADAGSGYLYASTTADWQAWPEPCVEATVSIRLGGCSGTVIASDSDFEFASTSVSLDSIYWNQPRSRHQADWEARCMLFNY
jgi:hypothetical protein